MRFKPPGRGVTFWTVLYGLAGIGAVCLGVHDGSGLMVVLGLLLFVPSLGMWFGSSTARWVLFGFLCCGSILSIIYQLANGFQVRKVAVLVTAIAACIELFQWKPDGEAEEG